MPNGRYGSPRGAYLVVLDLDLDLLARGLLIVQLARYAFTFLDERLHCGRGKPPQPSQEALQLQQQQQASKRQ